MDPMTQRRTRDFLLSDALDMFLLDCAARRLTDGTLQFYKSKLDVFFHWCDNHDIGALTDITAHDIRRFWSIFTGASYLANIKTI
jgi:site-specific recombinase XerD